MVALAVLLAITFSVIILWVIVSLATIFWDFPTWGAQF